MLFILYPDNVSRCEDLSILSIQDFPVVMVSFWFFCKACVTFQKLSMLRVISDNCLEEIGIHMARFMLILFMCSSVIAIGVFCWSQWQLIENEASCRLSLPCVVICYIIHLNNGGLERTAYFTFSNHSKEPLVQLRGFKLFN